MSDVFPSILKTAKVVPLFKKISKLDYSDYRPNSVLSNIEKTLEKPIKDCMPFSILSITYSLDSNNNILHLMP